MTAIKVWKPAEESADEAITMREAYRRFLRPSQAGRAAKKTLQAYETAIGHWEQFVANRGGSDALRWSTPSTPPVLMRGRQEEIAPIDDVRRITDAMLSEWSLSLTSGGMDASTVSKYWRFLRAILRRIGPRESGNPRAVGLLESVPAMDPIVAPDGSGDGQASIYSTDQLAALYVAADVASWPPPLPVLSWRAYIVLATCLGPRPESDLVRFTWANFRLDGSSPSPNSTAKHPAGFVHYKTTKTKRRIVVPLPACVRVHLDALSQSLAGAATIFGWSVGAHNKRLAQWHAIAAQAGMPDADRKTFRATCNVLWNRASKSDLGKIVLGHSANDINTKHYMRFEPELIEVCDRLELPECFSGSAESARQLFLF